MKKFVFGFLIVFILVALLELSAFLFSLTDFGTAYINQNLPTYSLSKYFRLKPNYWDFNAHFGNWHQPHSEFQYKRTCFSADYKVNSFGMRDAERNKNSGKERVIVLGDSYVEGWGVNDPFRFTNLLEKATGIEHLNFGIFGYGTTQYYLLYKGLAKNFAHSKILIGVLPHNDFEDNDIEFQKKFRKNQRRPFLVGEYPNYRRIDYPENFEEYSKKKNAKPASIKYYLKRFLREFSYAYVIYLEIRKRLAAEKDASVPQEPVSKFYSFNEEQFNLARYGIEKILEEAGDKSITVALLPSSGDFESYDPSGEPPLSLAFKKLGEEIGFQALDLLPLMYRATKNWRDYFFSCDEHWNEYGNRTAAQIIKEALHPK